MMYYISNNQMFIFTGRHSGQQQGWNQTLPGPRASRRIHRY